MRCLQVACCVAALQTKNHCLIEKIAHHIGTVDRQAPRVAYRVACCVAALQTKNHCLIEKIAHHIGTVDRQAPRVAYVFLNT